MNVFKGKTVLVGVTGGIAAYKTCSLVSKLTQLGADVHVMMTENATRFVSPLTFETLSHNRAVVDTFDRNFSWEVGHVSLAKKADILVIAPATANVIAKLAHGIADDFLTTTTLACKCVRMFAPAMNTAMLEDAATAENMRVLESRGYKRISGKEGYLACGDNGGGRMAEPDVILSEMEKVLSVERDLEGKTVVVTSGGTRAPVDPVRFLTNRSSGKMGYCLATAAYERGAKVVYIKGFTDSFVIPEEWTVVDVATTSELLDAIKKYVPSADITVMAAAPCDYEIKPAEKKIKSDSLCLELKKAPDCAAWAGKNKGAGKLVIFAAETNDCIENAEKKFKNKNADLAVLNDVTKVGAGFDCDTNIVTLITKDGEENLPILKKRELADIILDKVVAL